MPSLVPAEAAVTNNDPPATPRTCQHLSKHFRHHKFIIIIIYISVRIKKNSFGADKIKTSRCKLDRLLLPFRRRSMAATRACLVALVMALAFLSLLEGAAAAGSAGRSALRRRQVRSLLRRINKAPLVSIQVLADRPSIRLETIRLSLSFFSYSY